jgi:hypothetical protein|nr:MAG TPA: hypothetical protein [Caudoviricetes sp.]
MSDILDMLQLTYAIISAKRNTMRCALMEGGVFLVSEKRYNELKAQNIRE